MKKNIYRIFTLLFTLTILLLGSTQVKAQLPKTCSSFQINPQTGQQGTSFNAVGENCLLDYPTSYIIQIYYTPVGGTENLYGSGFEVLGVEGCGASGTCTQNFTQSLGTPTGVGSYRVKLYRIVAFPDNLEYETTFAVTQGAGGVVPLCGDIVPFGTPTCDPSKGLNTNCCPSLCPTNADPTKAGQYKCLLTQPGFVCGSQLGAGINTALGCVPLNNIESTVGFLIGRITLLSGGISFILIVLGGIQIIFSNGNSEKVAEGQSMLTSAVGGLLFSLFSIFIQTNINSILKLFPQ